MPFSAGLRAFAPARPARAGARSCGGFFDTLAAVWALPSSLFGLVIAFWPYWAVRVLRARCPCRAPGPGVLPGPPFGPRLRRSPFGRHIGSGLRRLFSRLPRGVAHPYCKGFPLSAACQGLPLAIGLRMLAGYRPFGGGSCRPHPPQPNTIGGAAPVNPCPRSARGGAVFFMVSCAFGTHRR